METLSKTEFDTDSDWFNPAALSEKENERIGKSLNVFFNGLFGLSEKRDEFPHELSDLIKSFFGDGRMTFALNAGDGSTLAAFDPAYSFGIEPSQALARTRQGRYNAVVGEYELLLPIFTPFEKTMEDAIIVLRETDDAEQILEFAAAIGECSDSRLVVIDKGENGEKCRSIPGVFASVSMPTAGWVAYFGMDFSKTKAARGQDDAPEFVNRDATTDTIDLLGSWVEEKRSAAMGRHSWESRSENARHFARDRVELYRCIHREYGRRYLKGEQSYDIDLVGGSIIQFDPSEWCKRVLVEIGRDDIINRLHKRSLSYFAQHAGFWDELLILEDKGVIAIDPRVTAAVTPIVWDARKATTPLRQPKIQERIAYLSDVSEIKCLKDDESRNLKAGTWYRVTLRQNCYEVKFSKTEKVKTELKMVDKKRAYIRTQIIIDGRHSFYDDDLENQKYLISYFAIPDPGSIQTRYPEEFAAAMKLITDVQDEYLTPRGYKFKPYQAEDTAALAFTGRGINAHEQGLGKTIQGLAFIEAMSKKAGKTLPSLIIAPQDLIPQWQAEAKKFYGIELVHLGRHKGGKPVEVVGANGEKTNISTGAITNLIEAMKLARHLKRNPYAGGHFITHFEALTTGGSKNLCKVEEPFTIRMEPVQKWIDPGYRTIEGVRTYFPGGYENSEKEITSADECPNCGGDFAKDQVVCHRMTRTHENDPAPKKCGYTRLVYRLPSIGSVLSTAFRKGVIVVDEGTQIASAKVSTEKNSSQKTKAVVGLRAANRLVMSGTPVKNFIAQAFWLLWWSVGGVEKKHEDGVTTRSASKRFPYPYVGGKADFAKDYSVFEWTWNDDTGNWANKREAGEVTNVTPLWKQLASVMIRRTKEQTGELIPVKKVHVINAPLGYYQREQMDFWIQNFHALFAEKNPDDPKVKRGTHKTMAAMLGADVKLNYASVLPKADPDWDWTGVEVSNWTPGMLKTIETVMALVAQGRRVLVGTDVKKASAFIASALAEKGIGVKTMLGSSGDTLTPPERSMIVQEFQEGVLDVISSTQKAIRLGHNLDKGSACVFFGLDWDYETFAQFRDRVHRLTSADPVDVYVILPGEAQATIVGRKWDVIQDKGRGAALAIDGMLPEKGEEPLDLKEIIRELMEKGIEATGDEIEESQIEAAWEDVPHISAFKIPEGFADDQALPWVIDWDAANARLAEYLEEQAEILAEQVERGGLIAAELDAYLDEAERLEAVRIVGEFLQQTFESEDEDEACRTCGEAYSGFGDGADGECGNCADITDAADETDEIVVPERPTTPEEIEQLPILDPAILLPAPAAPPVFDTSSVIQQLKDVAELHTLGVLDDAEFAEAKAALISQMKAAVATPAAEGVAA